MRKYIKNFIHDGQEGIETIEFIGLVIVAAVLIGIVASIGMYMAQQGNTATGQMTDSLNTIVQWGANPEGNPG